MILVTHFACCHQYKGYWRSCPLGWSYFTVMPGLNLRAGGAHAPEFTIRRTMKELMCAPACGAIVWGFVIETAEIGVSLLNLQLPIAFDFDLCYHANAELLDCPEL